MRKLPIIMLAMMFSIVATAQTIIPKLGGSLANVSLSEDFIGTDMKTEMKTGFLFGVGYEIGISDLLAIQPELLFHQKGTKLAYSEGNYSFEQKIGLNYLELPVLVKLKFGNFYVAAGPYVAFGIGGSYEAEEDDAGDIFSESGKVKFGTEPDNYSGDDFYIDNAFDFGFALGGGIRVFDKIVIDLRYSMGLADLFDVPDGAPSDFDNKSKNSSIQLTVGYPISFK